MSREYYSNVELEYEISKKIQGSYLWMGIGLLITFGIMFLGLYNTDLAVFSIEISRVSFVIMIALVFGMDLELIK